jgi:hypothetical protein
MIVNRLVRAKIYSILTLGLDVLNKMVNVIAVLPMSPSNSSRTEFPVNSGTSIGCNFSIKKKRRHITNCKYLKLNFNDFINKHNFVVVMDFQR